jgi:hypothetical protein
MDVKDLHFGVRGPNDDLVRDDEGNPINLKVLVIVDANDGPGVNSRPSLHITTDMVVMTLIEAFCGLVRTRRLPACPTQSMRTTTV